MKKTIITVLAAMVLLCSCNIDSDCGIFSEIVDSEESVKINTKAYLGQKSAEAGIYYYLTDTGIYRTGSNEAIYSCTDGLIDYAALVNDTLLVLRKNGSLTIDDGSNAVTAEGKYTKLLPNGYLYRNDNTICLFDGTSVTVCESIGAGETVDGFLWADGAALVHTARFDEALSRYVFKEYLFEGTAIAKEFESESTRCSGFQATGDASCPYVMVRYSSSEELFQAILVKSDFTTEALDLNSNPDYATSTQCPTFCYSLDSKLYIAVKTANYFDIINLADKTIESTRDGFAESIRTASICNIMGTGEPGIFIAATWNGFLYRITINETTNEAVQL